MSVKDIKCGEIVDDSRVIAECRQMNEETNNRAMGGWKRNQTRPNREQKRK